MHAVRVGDREIALYHLPGGDFRATDNICTHEYALLSDGWLEDGCIECPLHAARFDVKTGKALCAPAETNLQVFEVKVEGSDLSAEGQYRHTHGRAADHRLRSASDVCRHCRR